MNKAIYSILILITVQSPSALAWNILTRNFDINCNQSDLTLNCDYRSLKNLNVNTINAKSNDLDLGINNLTSFSDSGEQLAILYLVDTSDPGRQAVLEKNKNQIKKFFSNIKVNEQVGIASFDKSLTLLAPIGSSISTLNDSINTLSASGKTTELYRNMLKAMEELDAVNAKRKLLVLLSDGQAEDKAYFHSDVIKFARSSGIIINTIGYPRSVSLSVALQTLRRLSEESGGTYIESDMSYNLPSDSISSFFNSINSGGAFSVSLENLTQSEVNANTITLVFGTDAGNKLVNVPVDINSNNQMLSSNQETPVKIIEKVVTVPVAAPTPPANPPVQIIKQQEPQPVNIWLWYGLPTAFIIIIIFMLIILYLLWRKPIQTGNNSQAKEYRPYAYLISNDESKTRYPITRTICRIGRSKDNEISLDDTSVSRRHAEIHRTNDGKFEILDTNSTNGVYINNEKIGKAELNEDDLLEIGDFFMNFTLHAADYAYEEQTEMQNTRMPSIS